MPSVSVSAIVLNYRTSKDAVRCIEALLKQASPPNPLSSAVHSSVQTKDSSHQGIEKERGVPQDGVRPLEILVVDNHSADESIQYLRNRYRSNSDVQILEAPKNIGYGQGNMLAASAAKGTYILIINPDNELEPTGLQKMVEVMEHDETIGVVAPKLVHRDGTLRDSARKFPTVWDIIMKRTFIGLLFPSTRVLDYSDLADVDWVAGACILVRRALFQELQGFDPHFFLFFEDTDFCRRVWRKKKRVCYLSSVIATDRKERLSEGGLTSLLTKKTARIHLISGIKYFMKWGFRASDRGIRT